MFTDEQWKPVREFPEHYEISNYGRLRRLKAYRSIKAGQLRKPQMLGKYPAYWLSIAQSVYARSTHRLVADAFLGPIPKGMQVNHIDGDKMNCHVSNLEIVTNSENRIHSYRTLGISPNRGAVGAKNPHVKLNWQKVDQIRRDYLAGGRTYQSLADEHGVSKVLIGQVVRLKIWQERDRPS